MKVVIDFNNINSKEEFHNLLKEKLQLNNYHNNLDSLNDELTSIFYNITIIIKNIDYVSYSIGEYINVFKELLKNIQDEKNNIIIYYE